MRTRIAVLLVLATGAGACGGETSSTDVSLTTPRIASQHVRPTPARVIAAFRRAGLEVGSSHSMQHDDYGLAPLVAKAGERFLIPSLGDDNGGRVFTFTNVDDLRTLRSYYADLGRKSAAFYSWTFANPERRVLVQINGDLARDRAARYGDVVAAL